MSSNKSSAPARQDALTPQRLPGRKRVAELLEAAEAVIAERGFEAATMTEVAARAGSPIGSLYRFFPSKEVLAEALVRRHAELVDAGFARIEGAAAGLSIAALNDAFLDLMIDLHGKSRAVVAILDVESPRRLAFRQRTRRRIAGILRLRQPRLPARDAAHIAVALLHGMKAMVRLSSEEKGPARVGAMAELREMTRLYLADRLGP